MGKGICITGHRSEHLPWLYYEIGEQFNNFISRLKNALINNINNGYDVFYIGMARGIDMIAGELLIELKKQYNIKLVCVPAYINQENHWRLEDRKRYKNLINKADDVIALRNDYNISAFMIRNKYMVNNSDKVIACYANIAGGTLNTINYAKAIGKEIEFVSIY